MENEMETTMQGLGLGDQRDYPPNNGERVLHKGIYSDYSEDRGGLGK